MVEESVAGRSRTVYTTARDRSTKRARGRDSMRDASRHLSDLCAT